MIADVGVIVAGALVFITPSEHEGSGESERDREQHQFTSGGTIAELSFRSLG